MAIPPRSDFSLSMSLSLCLSGERTCLIAKERKRKKMVSAGRGMVKGYGKSVQSLWRTIWRFLKNLQIELPYNPAIPLLGIYPKDRRILNQKSALGPAVSVMAMSLDSHVADSSSSS